MQKTLNDAVNKNRKLKTTTELKTYRKDGKIKKDLKREVVYTSSKPCDCETSND